MPQEEVEQPAASKAEGQKQEFTFTSEDLEQYVQDVQDVQVYPIAEAATLKSQLYVKGYAEFCSALEDAVDLAKLRKKHAKALLEDLEKAYKTLTVAGKGCSL